MTKPDTSEVCMATTNAIAVAGLHVPSLAMREIVDDTTAREAVIIGVHNPVWNATSPATDTAISDAIFSAILETHPPPWTPMMTASRVRLTSNHDWHIVAATRETGRDATCAAISSSTSDEISAAVWTPISGATFLTKNALEDAIRTVLEGADR